MQQSEGRICLHPRDEVADRIALHQAIGVKDHDVFIRPAGFADEIFDVSSLAAMAVCAVAVEDWIRGAIIGEKRGECRSLCDQRVRVEGIG